MLTIPSQCSRLIAKQVLYTAKLLWESARAYDGVGYLGITHNLLCIDRLSHVQVDTQTVRGSVTAKFEWIDITDLMGIMEEKMMRNRKM